MTDNPLKSIVEELERLAEAKAEIAAEEAGVKAEAKARGYSVKVITTIIKLRRMSPEERDEYEGLVDLYKAELGMLSDTPLGRAAREWLSKKAKPKGEGAAGDAVARGDGAAAGDGAAKADAPAPEDTPAEEPPDEPAGPTPKDIAAARQAGGAAFADGADVLDNPYTAGDPRRAAWDEGFCMAAGSDGMDLPDAWKPASARKGKPKGGGEEGKGDE